MIENNQYEMTTEKAVNILIAFTSSQAPTTDMSIDNLCIY